MAKNNSENTLSNALANSVLGLKKNGKENRTNQISPLGYFPLPQDGGSVESASPIADGSTYYNTSTHVIRVKLFGIWYDMGVATGASVSSVALALPASVFTISGSPVTTSGTLTGSFINQNANKVFAGPTTGSPAAPDFRSLVLDDIPGSIPNSKLANSTIALTLGTTGTDLGVAGSPASLGAGLTLNVPTASASNRGALSSTDWSTFNSKQNALSFGNLTEATSSVLTITGGTGSVIGSGASIQVKLASTSQSGYLSNTDWNTFNNKQNALSFGNLTVGTDLNVSGGSGAVIGSGTSISLSGNVVTGVTNDTNVTGVIATNTLTLGWTGLLAAGRGGTGVGSLSDVVGTTNQVNVSGGIGAVIGGNVTLSLPQDIHSGASPTFVGLTLTGKTQGSVLFVGASGVVSENNTAFYWDNSQGTLVFPNGTTATGGSQMVIRAVSNGTSLVNAFEVFNSAKATSRGNFAFRRGRGNFASQSLANSGDSIGSFTFESNVGSNSWGYSVKILGMAGGTITNTSSPGRLVIYTQPDGTVTETALIEAIRIDKNQHVSIGTVADPTALLELKAGSATAGTAPAKFNSGTLLTSPEVGAFEFLTDSFFLTITTGAARKEIVLADSGLTSGRVPFATTNGRLTDDSDMTFATDTLTVTKIVGSTSITDSGLTSGRVVYSGAVGLLTDNSAFTFDTTNGLQLNKDFKLKTAGNGIYVKEGTNATMGTATLSGGAITVSTTKVTANSRIFLASIGSNIRDVVYIDTINAGTSFDVKSVNGTDFDFFWIIIEPS